MPTTRVCPTCKQPTRDLEFDKKVKDILGPDMDLYDFGGGLTVVPEPDLPNGSYLTSHIAAIYRMEDSKARFLVFRLEANLAGPKNQGYFEQLILERLPEVKKQFDEKAREELTVEGII